MKSVFYTGPRVSFPKIISCSLLCFCFCVSTVKAQPIYFSSFSDPTNNYLIDKPGCLVGVSVPSIDNAERVATSTLTDFATLNPGSGLTLTAALACSGLYSVRTNLNLNGLPALPASITPYNVGFKVRVSDAATLSLLGGNSNRLIVRTFLNGVAQDVANGGLIGLSALQAGVIGNIGFQTNKDFNQVAVEISSGLLSLDVSSSIDFFYAYASTEQVPIVLPVKLTTFSAIAENKSIGITWATTSEINMAAYELQRSSNGGTTFSTVTTVAAKGNTAAETKYTYTDGSAFSGSYIYRLKMIDKDGKAEYSKLVNVKLATGANWKVYPTLLNSGSDLNVSLTTASAKTQVQLANLQGQLLRTASAGTNNKMTINTSSLAAGVYVLKLYQDGRLQASEKIVIQ